MGSWGRSQMKMKWKAKVQIQQLCRKDGTADNRKACRNNGSNPPGERLKESLNKPSRGGGVDGKAFQQIGAVGLLSTTETCVSHCDLLAQWFVVMARLRGAQDSGALTQGAARGSLADLCLGGHFSPAAVLQRGRRCWFYPSAQGWWELSLGTALDPPFMKVVPQTCGWASSVAAFLNLGNPWKTQERKANFWVKMNSIKTIWREMVWWKIFQKPRVCIWAAKSFWLALVHVRQQEILSQTLWPRQIFHEILEWEAWFLLVAPTVPFFLLALHVPVCTRRLRINLLGKSPENRLPTEESPSWWWWRGLKVSLGGLTCESSWRSCGIQSCVPTSNAALSLFLSAAQMWDSQDKSEFNSYLYPLRNISTGWKRVKDLFCWVWNGPAFIGGLYDCFCGYFHW